MQVQEIAEPGGGGPGLLGIPGPIVAPGLLGPKGTHHYAHRQETPAYADEGVAETEVGFERSL